MAFEALIKYNLTSLRSGQDVGFRGELVRRDSRIELDEDLVPQGVEVLTRDGAEHGRESLRLVQVIRNEDGLDARVVREDRGGGFVRQLKHVDGDGVTIEESGDLSGSALRVFSRGCLRCERQRGPMDECGDRAAAPLLRSVSGITETEGRARPSRTSREGRTGGRCV